MSGSESDQEEAGIDDPVLRAMVRLSRQVRELYVGESVEVLDRPPTPLELSRIIALNRPVIIRNAVSHWAAFGARPWTNEYLRRVLGESEVTVAVTPNGRADAVTEYEGREYFAVPYERRMRFSEFVDVLESPDPTAGGVHYVQLQNDCLNTEYRALLGDVAPDVPFATEALGRPPDAVNFWMGGSATKTSLHKDNYENFYVVVAGRKHFTLYPPQAHPFLYEREYESAAWRPRVEGGFKGFELVPCDPPQRVPWIAFDPSLPAEERAARFPLAAHARGLRVALAPGEMLFLPAMWYHEVGQTADAAGRVVAVNFWYDMAFDHRFAAFHFLRDIAAARTRAGAPPPPPPGPAPAPGAP